MPRFLCACWLTLALVPASPALRAASGEPALRTTEAYRPSAFEDPARADRIRALAGEIDELYRNYAVQEHFPGLAYGIVLDDRLVVSGAYGFTDVARKLPATPRSVFRIASMTKSFTAMSVLRLRDAGRVELDRPASRYLPEMRRLKLLTADSGPITVRHLLTHGAGFPEDNPWGDRQLADSESHLVELIRKPVQFANAPGVAYEYSNLGFALLGRLVHRVSGQSCQGYISGHILRPLGMQSSYWDEKQVPRDLLAHGYRWRDGEWQEEPMLADGAYGPMGGMFSTVEDFARYLSLHLSAWPPRDDPETGPVRRASLREMQHPWRISVFNPQATRPDESPCPLVSAYGYGVGWTRDCDERIRIGHTGGLPGFGSQWRIFPEYGLGIVALGNITYANFTPLHAKVQELLLGKGGLPRRVLPPSGILRQRAAALARLLPDWIDAERSGIFAENFFADNPADSLRKEAREMFQKAGAIEAVGEVKALNQLRGTFILHGRNGNLEVFFTLTPENPPLVQEYHLREPVPAPVSK